MLIMYDKSNTCIVYMDDEIDNPNDNVLKTIKSIHGNKDFGYITVDDFTFEDTKDETFVSYNLINTDGVVTFEIYRTTDGYEKPVTIMSPEPPTLEKQLTKLQNQLMTADERYKTLDKTTVLIGEMKVAKLAQLEELCEKSIVDGFDHTINNTSYRFSCSINAQANFQGTDTLFKDGLITEAEWTVTNNTTGTIERVMLDQVAFNQIKLQVFTHINSNISKLRNTLQLQVESALTNDEIDLITW